MRSMLRLLMEVVDVGVGGVAAQDPCEPGGQGELFDGLLRLRVLRRAIKA